MKNPVSFTRLLSFSFALLFLLVTACGSDKGKVESSNMLYGTSSKVWKTDKQVDAGGDKVSQSDADENMEMSFSANGTYSGTQSGTYVFDQPAKTLTLTPTGSTTANTFTVETLTEDKLTLVGTSGAKLMLTSK